MLRSIMLFIIAGFCEIAGGYGVWLWLRNNRSIGFAIAGAVLLVLYGVIPTLQSASFGRVYAAYGGVFVVLSILWGWGIDGVRPDRFDLIGGGICLAGIWIIMYAPRS